MVNSFKGEWNFLSQLSSVIFTSIYICQLIFFLFLFLLIILLVEMK